MNYKYKTKRWGFFIILNIAILIFITGCANNRNIENNQTGQTGDTQGLAQSLSDLIALTDR